MLLVVQREVEEDGSWLNSDNLKKWCLGRGHGHASLHKISSGNALKHIYKHTHRGNSKEKQRRTFTLEMKNCFDCVHTHCPDLSTFVLEAKSFTGLKLIWWYLSWDTYCTAELSLFCGRKIADSIFAWTSAFAVEITGLWNMKRKTIGLNLPR